MLGQRGGTACPPTRRDRRRPTVALLRGSKRLNTSANSARCWGKFSPWPVGSRRSGRLLSRTCGCANSRYQTAESKASTPARSGTTAAACANHRVASRTGRATPTRRRVWRTKNGPAPSTCRDHAQVAYQGGHIEVRRRQARAVGLRRNRADPARDAAASRTGAQASANPDFCPAAGCVVTRTGGSCSQPAKRARPARLREGRTVSLDTKRFGATSITVRPSSKCCVCAAASS